MDGRGGGGGVVACRSARDAYGLEQFCCSGEFSNPTTCRPSFYSSLFKNASPRAYTYAFDDATSTFTCSNAYDYDIIFCPRAPWTHRSDENFSVAESSQKIWSNPPPSSSSSGRSNSLHPLGITTVLLLLLLLLAFMLF